MAECLKNKCYNLMNKSNVIFAYPQHYDSNGFTLFEISYTGGFGFPNLNLGKKPPKENYAHGNKLPLDF